jgi:hypothetical protein
VARSIQAAVAAIGEEAPVIGPPASYAADRPPTISAQHASRLAWLRAGTAGITKHAAERYLERFNELGLCS